MAYALAAVLLVVFFVAGFSSILSRLPPGRPRLPLPPLAEALDLDRRGGQLVGTRAGHSVVVHPPTDVGGGWTAIVDHSVPLAPRDGAASAPVQRILDQRPDLAVHIDRTYVSVTSQGARPGTRDADAVAEGIETAVAVVAALRETYHGWVVSLSQATGLSRLDGATLEGEIDGSSVSVVVPRRLPEGWELIVRGRLREPLPEGSRLRAAEASGPDVELGDLFLDQTLAVTTTDPAALRSRLARDEVRGPLLDLLCRFRGSVVTEEEIVHVVREGGNIDVKAAVERVVELVDAIG